MKILDHGEVRLLDSMASDLKVVGAARVSTGHTPELASKGLGPDVRLINFLMTNGHGTPFEHSVFQFYVGAPIFVIREWVRHRIASYNEFSARYSEMTERFYLPTSMRVPDPKNKQVSQEVESEAFADYRKLMENANEHSFAIYRKLISAGMARELARTVLPVSSYSAFWWTINARSLLNFLELRNSDDAQHEIRVYAEAIEEIFIEHMPITHEAFVKAGRRAP